MERHEARSTKACTNPSCPNKAKRTRVFRLLRDKATGEYRQKQGMCRDCERAYEQDRWHRRSDKSKRESGGAALKRRLQKAA